MSELKPGTLEVLFSQNLRRFEDVPFPRLEVTFRVQSLTERERSEYESLFVGKNGKLQNLAAQRRVLVARTLVDATGQRMLQDRDADKLADLDAEVVGKLFDVASRLCGLATEKEPDEKN